MLGKMISHKYYGAWPQAAQPLLRTYSWLIKSGAWGSYEMALPPPSLGGGEAPSRALKHEDGYWRIRKTHSKNVNFFAHRMHVMYPSTKTGLNDNGMSNITQQLWMKLYYRISCKQTSPISQRHLASKVKVPLQTFKGTLCRTLYMIIDLCLL